MIKKLIDKATKIELKTLSGLGKLGFEKESLRVFQSKIVQTPHSKSVGSALCNKYITTDFSEAQLELITPPLSDKRAGMQFLEDIHHYVASNIDNEILWPFSIPPYFKSDKEIPIANYGSSNLGLFKHIYRNGLAHRYGRTMQSISGLHYNYSLPDSVWDIPFFKAKKIDSKSLRSYVYFRMLRNIFRMNWLILYLFGASPLLTKNFIHKDKALFKKLDNQTYYLPYATSLRMSEFGYQNSLRNRLNVSSSSLGNYISDLNIATNTVSKDFTEINSPLQNQLNTNILQIEDEYYAIARAKSNIISNQSSTSKLKKGGVDFIELRSLDLNPFSRIGINLETVLFLEVFLVYCFIKESSPISKAEQGSINKNDLSVAKFGRTPNFSLQKEGKIVSLKEWGNQILDEMTPIVELFDQNKQDYLNMILTIRSQINDPNQTLSGQLLDRLLSKQQSFIDLGNSIGEANRQHYLNLDFSNNQSWDLLDKEAINSLVKQKSLEDDNEKTFEDFLSLYFNR